MLQLSPYAKYATMINLVTPYNCSGPMQNNGNMLDVPSHFPGLLGPKPGMAEESMNIPTDGIC